GWYEMDIPGAISSRARLRSEGAGGSRSRGAAQLAPELRHRLVQLERLLLRRRDGDVPLQVLQRLRLVPRLRLDGGQEEERLLRAGVGVGEVLQLRLP